MSYGFYKIIHIASIVLFFALYMSAVAKKSEKIKLETILTGICLILILVSGMGLVARIGIPHNVSWPMWLTSKVGIWFIIGMFGHVVLKRFKQHAAKFFYFAFVLLILAVYLVNFKPF